MDFTLRLIKVSMPNYFTSLFLNFELFLIPIFTEEIHDILDLIPTARPIQIIGLAAHVRVAF